jgi:hypothetical protein
MGRAGLCKISGKNIEIPEESFDIFNHSLKAPTQKSLYENSIGKRNILEKAKENYNKV